MDKVELVNDSKILDTVRGNLKDTSTIRITLEDKGGYAETFTFLDLVSDFNNGLNNKELITKRLVTVSLDGEECTIQVPLLKGYQKPYDWAITDEIGTEHFIYYEELKDNEEL